MIRRKNRRERATARAYPVPVGALVIAQQDATEGFTSVYTLASIPLGDPGYQSTAYTDPLTITDKSSPIGNTDGTAVASIGYDNGGAGGATRLRITWAGAVPAAGKQIMFPPQFLPVRGSRGEYMAAQIFTHTV